MPTYYLDPDEDVSIGINWANFGNPFWSSLDDSIRQPTNSGFDGGPICSAFGSMSFIVLGCETFTLPVDERVTSVKLWANRQQGGEGSPTSHQRNCQIYVGATQKAESGAVTESDSGDQAGWYSVTEWTPTPGTVSQADIDDLRIRFGFQNSSGSFSLRACYLEVTTEAIPAPVVVNCEGESGQTVTAEEVTGQVVAGEFEEA